MHQAYTSEILRRRFCEKSLIFCQVFNFCFNVKIRKASVSTFHVTLCSVSSMPLQTLRNPRLDALQYDQDIEELLFQRVRTVFSGLPTPVASFLECSHHELRLLVRTLIWGVHLSKGMYLCIFALLLYFS